MADSVHLYDDYTWSTKNSLPADSFTQKRLEFIEPVFNVFIGFESKEVAGACDGVEKYLGVRKKDLTVKKLYSLIYPQDRIQVLAEDRAMQKRIHQSAEARRKLLYSFSVRQFRMLTADNYREVRRRSVVYKFGDMGLPAIVWFRFWILSRPAANYVASDLEIYQNGERGFRMEEEEAFIKQMTTKYFFSALSKQFTPTQLDICEYLLNDLTSQQIADIMGTSPKTVDKHRSNIIEKGKAISPVLDTALKVAAFLRRRGLI